MTPEELLKPRYKVIADYFYNPYKIGDIITVEYEDRSVHLTTTHYRDEFGETVDNANYFNPARLKDFPHLFQPLEWWEDRRIDEVPEYVKCIKTPDQQIMPGMILKVTWVSGWGTSGRHVVVLNTGCFEPATKQEYLEYIKQKEGR